MGEHIIRNLDKIRCQKRVGGRIYVLSNLKDSKKGNMSYFEVTRPSKPHYHREMMEMYFVVSGQGKILIDGKEERLKKGTFVMLKPSVVHQVVPDSGFILRIVICSIPSWREKDEFEIQEKEASI